MQMQQTQQQKKKPLAIFALLFSTRYYIPLSIGILVLKVTLHECGRYIIVLLEW